MRRVKKVVRNEKIIPILVANKYTWEILGELNFKSLISTIILYILYVAEFLRKSDKIQTLTKSVLQEIRYLCITGC